MQGNVKISQGRSPTSPVSAVGRSMGGFRQVAAKGAEAETQSAEAPERLSKATGDGRGQVVPQFFNLAVNGIFPAVETYSVTCDA
jgi:hypothetical protein